MDLPIRLARKYLNRNGFTPQRPMKRAFEQQPEPVQQWLQSDYPPIAARAKAEVAEICRGKVTSHLQSIQKQPQRVRSRFRAKPVAYAAQGYEEMGPG